MDEPFITVEDITIRLRDKFILQHTSWNITTGQQWAILGPNGAGKSSLVRALIGHVPYVHGNIIYHFSQRPYQMIGYVSSELQEYLIAIDEYQDMSRYFSHKLDDVNNAREIILDGNPDRDEEHPEFEKIIDILGIRYILDRGMRNLSSGEMRKTIIARALVKSPKLLILDEPFLGIDAESREQLIESINELIKGGLQVVQVTHRVDEIIPLISNVICIKNRQVLLQGKRDVILTKETLDCLYDAQKSSVQPLLNTRERDAKKGISKNPDILVEMRNVNVKYRNVRVLNNLNWTVRRGENWAITGPNGSGKTTLLRLITGDNPHAYANEVYLFGRRRGSGESIWDIKARIGTVSLEFQTAYKKKITAYDTVASGIFDTIGLYRNPNPAQKRQVNKWIDFFGISHIADKMFNQLSFGERRMVLLARSMVKSPELLVMDEPCQGLDQENRSLFLSLIESIGKDTDTNILYVTHHQDELPRCIDFVLKLKKG